jgi:hypothetical protein
MLFSVKKFNSVSFSRFFKPEGTLFLVQSIFSKYGPDTFCRSEFSRGRVFGSEFLGMSFRGEFSWVRFPEASFPGVR